MAVLIVYAKVLLLFIKVMEFLLIGVLFMQRWNKPVVNQRVLQSILGGGNRSEDRRTGSSGPERETSPPVLKAAGNMHCHGLGNHLSSVTLPVIGAALALSGFALVGKSQTAQDAWNFMRFSGEVLADGSPENTTRLLPSVSAARFANDLRQHPESPSFGFIPEALGTRFGVAEIAPLNADVPVPNPSKFVVHADVLAVTHSPTGFRYSMGIYDNGIQRPLFSIETKNPIPLTPQYNGTDWRTAVCTDRTTSAASLVFVQSPAAEPNATIGGVSGETLNMHFEPGSSRITTHPRISGAAAQDLKRLSPGGN
jgi:hypothetical protein